MSEYCGRRGFLQGTAMAAAAAAVGGCSGQEWSKGADSRCCPKMKEARLRLSSGMGIIPGETLAQKLDKMEKWGFEGLEVGGGYLRGNVKQLKEALTGRAVKMSAICAGFDGWLIADDPAIRAKAMTTMKELLTLAGEVGSTGLIIVPAFNDQKSLPHKQARELLTGFKRWDAPAAERKAGLLQELGDHAAGASTRILLEPLNRGECYFLRTLADGASICRDVNNPGIALMGDFWHMTWEETSDCGAFLSAGEYLHHVHIASRRNRKTPTEDGEADNYVNGFRGLKMIGYQDFVSLECGTVGDKEKVLPACVQLLREQWAQA